MFSPEQGWKMLENLQDMLTFLTKNLTLSFISLLTSVMTRILICSSIDTELQKHLKEAWVDKNHCFYLYCVKWGLQTHTIAIVAFDSITCLLNTNIFQKKKIWPLGPWQLGLRSLGNVPIGTLTAQHHNTFITDPKKLDIIAHLHRNIYSCINKIILGSAQHTKCWKVCNG